MYGKIKSIFVATLFPLLYFVCQFLVQIVTFSIIKYKYGNKNSSIDIINQKVYMMTLCAAVLCFLILFLSSKFKKQGLFKNYKKVSFLEILFYSIGAIGLYMIIVIMNFMLIGFFPEYDNQIMGLFQIERPVLAVLVIGIVAPLIEELIFRGEVYGELEKNFTIPMVIFLQALLFGLIHPIPLQKIQTFIMGIFLGYARAKTENIWAPTIMHITSNLIACLLVFIML